MDFFGEGFAWGSPFRLRADRPVSRDQGSRNEAAGVNVGRGKQMEAFSKGA